MDLLNELSDATGHSLDSGHQLAWETCSAQKPELVDCLTRWHRSAAHQIPTYALLTPGEPAPGTAAGGVGAVEHQPEASSSGVAHLSRVLLDSRSASARASPCSDRPADTMAR